MSYIAETSHSIHLHNHEEREAAGVVRFFRWAENQDAANHIAWVGIAVMSMTAFFFPITMAVVLMNGALFGLIVGAMAALALVVVTNLASLPTKYTIPFFLLGILLDIAIMSLSFVLR